MTPALEELERILGSRNSLSSIAFISSMQTDNFRKLVIKLSTETSEAVIVSKAKAPDWSLISLRF